MRVKQTSTEESVHLPQPHIEPPALGNIFKKRGEFDGKLFHSSKKATYTFVEQQEVIALHFDKERKSIFYKGHNISNIRLSDVQRQHLELFQKALEKNPKTQPMVSAYKQALKAILP